MVRLFFYLTKLWSRRPCYHYGYSQCHCPRPSTLVQISPKTGNDHQKPGTVTKSVEWSLKTGTSH